MSEPKDEMRTSYLSYHGLPECICEECNEEEENLEPGEDVVHGCRKDEKGYHVGQGCDKWTTCPRCQCCYIHCLCQPDHWSEQDE